MSRRLASVVTVSAVLSAPLVMLTAAPSWAACSVFASKPVASGSANVSGNGGKKGCSTKNYTRVRLLWDRPLSPDPSLATRQGQYSNVTLYVVGDCLLGKHGYYTKTDGDQGSSSTSKYIRTCS